MKPGATHTSFQKGKRIRIVTRDGRVHVDKFVERTGKFVIFEHETFRSRDLKSCMIVR